MAGSGPAGTAVIFRQVLFPAMGCASYVFGCTGKGALAVVDAHADHIDVTEPDQLPVELMSTPTELNL